MQNRWLSALCGALIGLAIGLGAGAVWATSVQQVIWVTSALTLFFGWCAFKFSEAFWDMMSERFDAWKERWKQTWWWRLFWWWEDQ